MSLLYQVNEKQLAGITKAPTQNPYKPAASTASPENEIPVPTQSVTDDTARQLKVFNHSISVQFSQSLKDLQKDQIELVKKIDENHAKTIFVDKNTELSPILKENIDLSRVIILEASIRNAYNTFPYEMSLQVTGMNLPNTSFTLEANATNLILPMNVHHPPVQLLNKSDLIQNPLLRKYAHLDMKSLKEGTATINGSTFVAKQNDFSKFLLKNSGIFSSVKELDDKVSISNEHFSAAVTVFKDRVLRNIPHSNLTELGFVVKRANEKPLDCWENSQFAHLPEAEIDYLSGEVRNLSFTLDIKWAYSFPESLDEIAGHSAQLPINSYPK